MPEQKGKLTQLINDYLATAQQNESDAYKWLVENGMQGCLAKYLANAGAPEIQTFLNDVFRIDREWLKRHREAKSALTKPAITLLSVLPPFLLDKENKERLELIGKTSLKNGRWGVLIFSGGAATRFFSDSALKDKVKSLKGPIPKGLFPLTPVLGLPFLDFFAAQMLEIGIETGTLPPLILMVSSETADAIKAWRPHYPAEALIIIEQARHPRLDEDGDLVAHPDGRLVQTGDGHGGVFKALQQPRAGGDGGRDRDRGAEGKSVWGGEPQPGDSAMDKLLSMGVDSIVMHNVDNAGANALEAGRLGWFIDSNVSFGMTAVERTKVAEKVGIIAVDDSADRVDVVEYSVCPPELATAADSQGQPIFKLAHINTNLVKLDSINADLPPTLYSGKKVSVGGQTIVTSSLEMLNQHLAKTLPKQKVGVILMKRDESFMPTKSISGEDSLESTQATMARLWKERLIQAGGQASHDAMIELYPSFTPPGLWAKGWQIGDGATLALAIKHGTENHFLGTNLVLESGAKLSITAQNPYGEIRYAAKTRKISADPKTAAKVSLGNNVKLLCNVSIKVHINGSGVLVIKDGHIFDQSQTLIINSGEVYQIG